MSLLLLIIIALAAILRSLYFLELHNHPLLKLSIESNIFDQYRFSELAKIFYQGNLLGTIEEGHFSPTYSYFLALWYKLLGWDMLYIFFVQGFIGCIAVYVIYRVGHILFADHKVGLIAAAILAFYGPLIFFEGALLRAALIAYINLFALFFLLRGKETDKNRYFLFSGALFAYAHALRPGILLPIITIFVCICQFRRTPKRMVLPIIFILGMFCILTPFKMRNSMSATKQTIHQQNLSIFWIGNTHDSSGIGLWRSPLRMQLTQEASGSIPRSLQIFFREIKKHPTDYAALYYRKFKMFLNGYEIPANLNFYHFKELTQSLKFAWITFSWIIPFALIGLIAAIRKREQVGTLLLITLVLSASVIFFHVQGRYRIPSVPFYILFAARGIGELVNATQKREVLTMGLIVSCILFLNIWTAPDQGIIRKYFSDFIRPIDHVNLAIAQHSDYLAAGSENVAELNRIVENFQKAFAGAPASALGFRTDCLINIALFERKLGRLAESRQTFEKAKSLNHRPIDELKQNIVERDINLTNNPASFQYFYYF